MTFDSMLYTNPGGRDHNEDAVGEKAIPDGKLVVLADGLGGHRMGELASQSVVDSLLHLDPPAEGEDASAWLARGFAEANNKLVELQRAKAVSMRSTAVVLLLCGPHAAWAHLGDSRLYYFHRGDIAFVTPDHSVAYKKYRAGEITKAQIATDEDQSALLKSLGKENTQSPDIMVMDHKLEPGDAFLLCSDGVWEYVLDEEMLVDLLKADSPQEWIGLMLLRLIDRVPPSHDNLSLAAIMVK